MIYRSTIKTIQSLILLFCCFNIISAQILNVKDFGALGNGAVDDTPAIQKCLNKVPSLENTVHIFFPEGTYKITNTLTVSLSRDQKIEISGDSISQKYPLIKTDKFISVFEITSSGDKSNGEVIVKHMHIMGNNPPYNGRHPYINKPAYVNGLAIFNLAKVVIRDNIIENIYGEGINLNNFILTPQTFSSVLISNNKVLNCWGMNHNGGVVNDDYGDGVYVARATHPIIKNNDILNNVGYTHYMGRAGLVLEYDVSNAVVKNNNISGYDRNIHIESDLGGQLIEGNSLSASDIGLYIYSTHLIGDVIKDNLFNNIGTPYDMPYIPPVFNSNGRFFIMIHKIDGIDKNNSPVQIIGNKFIISALGNGQDHSIGLVKSNTLVTLRLNDFRSMISNYRRPLLMIPGTSDIENNKWVNSDLNFVLSK